MTTPAQPDADNAQDGAAALMRMVDFRIPLPWLLGGFLAAAAILTSMYFQLQKVSESLADLKVSVAAGNSASGVLAGRVELLQYRLDVLEAEFTRQRGGQVPSTPASPFRR